MREDGAGGDRAGRFRVSPPIGAFLGARGARLHYLADGPEGAPPLVLLHGASGNLRDWWLSIFAPLAARRRVIAFDRPGFGHSDPAPGRGWRLAEQGEALRAGLIALGIRRYALVGHSWAGALVLDWALRHPGEVTGIGVLAGATMDWGGGLDLQYRLVASPFVGRTLSALAPRLLHRRMIDRALRDIFAPQPVPERYRREGGAELALRPTTFRTNARALHALHEQVVANVPRYPVIGCPVEILHGTADRIVPASVHAGPLAGVVAQARLTLFDGVGHMPHHARPEAVVERLAPLGADADAA